MAFQLLSSIYTDDYPPSDTNFPQWLPTDSTYAPFLPTSIRRVFHALRLASCNPGDHLLDLGSGDGRFCVAALLEFGAARAVGVEADQELVQKSCELALQCFSDDKDTVLGERLQFVCGDFREKSITTLVHDPSITILVVFLSPEFAKECAEILIEHFERGCKIVSLVFELNEVQGLRLKVKDVIEGIWVYQRE